jgi:cyclase
MASQVAAEEVVSGPHTLPTVFSCDSWGDITPPKAIEPVNGPISLGTGENGAKVIPVPQTAHTFGDVIVWIPDERVLFAGDLLFNGSTPLAVFGSPAGWLEALDWLTGFDSQVVVPGHGPIVPVEDHPIEAMAEYLRWCLDAVRDPHRPDFDALEEEARVRWPRWSETERHAVNLRVAHAQAHNYALDFAETVEAMHRAAGAAPIALCL